MGGQSPEVGILKGRIGELEVNLTQSHLIVFHKLNS